MFQLYSKCHLLPQIQTGHTINKAAVSNVFHKYPQSCSENTDPEHGHSIRKSDSETEKLLEEAKPWLGMTVLPFLMDKRNGKE